MGASDQLIGITEGPPSFLGGRNVEWSENMARLQQRERGQAQQGGSGIRPDQCVELKNLDISLEGIAQLRPGVDALNSTALESGADIESIHFYTQGSTGTKYCMVQVNGKVGKLTLTTGAWTEVGAAGDRPGNTPLKWVTWKDKAWAFNGTGMFSYIGSTNTWAQVQDGDADAPDSTDGCVLDEILFTARDTTTYESRVPYSDNDDPTAWTATNFRRIREQDGQQIMGMDVIHQAILCRRSRSTVLLHGSSIYNFAEEWLSEEIGQIGRLTGARTREAVIWLGNKGVIYYDPRTLLIFNDITRDTCRTEVLTLGRSDRDAGVAAYHPKTAKYLLSFPDAATPIIYVFFLNMPQISPDGNTWFPHTTYTGLTITAMAVDDEEGSAGKLYFGSSTGYIYEVTGYDDADTNIAAELAWGYTDCGLPIATKNFSRVYVPAKATGALQVALDLDFQTRSKAKTTPTYTPAMALIWGTGKWDEKNWTGDYVGTKKVRFTKMNGTRAKVTISKDTTDDLQIHPFILEYTPKEPIRWR